jgi:hypothetical protein
MQLHDNWTRNQFLRPTTCRRVGPGLVGQYTAPHLCEHPIEARVWPDIARRVARCHDCGMYLLFSGKWELA